MAALVDTDMCENDESLYAYQLIEFILKGGPRKIKQIDIVPKEWIVYNKANKKLSPKFMPLPYDNENMILLHALVKNKASAPADWPVYPIKIKGRASK